MKLQRINLEDRPLAQHPYTSYRYRGPIGWIMIGAMDTDEALSEATRSICDESHFVNRYELQVWDGVKYADVVSH